MTNDVNRVRARADRTFGRNPPSQVLERFRAIVGNSAAMSVAEEGSQAVAALQAFQNGTIPSPTQLAALELLIRMTRPAPLFRAGKPDNLDDDKHLDTFPGWRIFQTAVGPYASSVGRVDTAGRSLAASRVIGTAFLVASDLVLTNRHVVLQLSRGTEQLERGIGVVRFGVQYDDFSPSPVAHITEVVRLHEALDAALLRVDPSLHIPLFPFDSNPPREDLSVVVVGYPVDDMERNPLFVRDIFGTQFEVLRAAPGLITRLHPSRFFHDCSTLGGNSGSPVLDMNTGRVVGMHVGGGFLWANEAVASKSLATFVSSS